MYSVKVVVGAEVFTTIVSVALLIHDPQRNISIIASSTFSATTKSVDNIIVFTIKDPEDMDSIITRLNEIFSKSAIPFLNLN